MILAEPPVVPA